MLVGLACAGLALPAVAEGPERTVAVAGGQLTGRDAGGGVTAYLGIPYAQAPTGALRWSEPRPVEHLGVREAKAFGPGCIQADTPTSGPWSKEYYASGPFSEDCLSLNVWSAARPGARRAVAVWIHGGGLVQGSSALTIYDGANLARAGIVVVSINYRLNVLGFLAHPDIARIAASGVAGNYGLMDDVAALRWVQRNIAAFGGDPAKVTIIGQSGGARSVQSLLFSPMAKGLFRGAIAESGIPWVIPGQGQEPGTLAEQMAAGEAFARSRGVATAAELRALPADRLIAPAPNTPFRGGFTIDGKWLPRSWSDSVGAAPVSDVPVILGHNLDEGDIRAPLDQPVSAEAYVAWVRKVYGAEADRVLALYPAAADSAKASQALGHARVMAGVVDWAGKRARAARSKVYVYDFTHRMPGPVHDSWGSYHSSEIVYWMRNLDKLDRPWTAQDRQVSRVLSGYWLNFIKTGQPNGPGLAAWEPYGQARQEVLDLGPAPRMRPANPPEIAAFFRDWYAKH